VKNGAFLPSARIFTVDYSHDDFLIGVFEKLTAIQRVAVNGKDLEISEQILDCFSLIAIKCTEIRYATNPMNEYAHCMLATEYTQQNIMQCLNVGLLDIGIQGSDRLKSIGLALIAKGSQTDVDIILDHLAKIAMYGLAIPNASYLIASPMKAYTILLRGILYNRKISHRFLPKEILTKVQQIIGLYIKTKETNVISVEMGSSIGDFVVLSRLTAMPYVFDEAYNKTQDPNVSDQDKKHLIETIIEFGHEVWHFYDELSKYAAEKESFLIHYIDANLEHIAMVLLKLYQMDILEEKQKEEILNNIEWIISVYLRIYDYHKEITKSYEYEILENLLKIGSEFNKLSLIKNLNEVVDIIVSIANSFLEKQKRSYGFDPIRIIERAGYLCILNGSEETYTNFLKKIKDKFWSGYCKRYPQNKELLFNELLEIYPDRLKYNRPHLSFEDELLCKLNREDIIKFVSKLRKNLE
jgi:hypothetical protein